MWVNRRYLPIALMGVIIPAAIGAIVTGSSLGAVSGFLWGGMVRLFVASNFVWSINSVCHSLGRRDYQTSENSRNVAVLAIPTFGESWHNNHHAFPSSARFGLRWWQIDIGYLLICLLRVFGLACKVRVAAPEDYEVTRSSVPR